MRMLVTGGAGFIGSHYVRTLLAGGYPGFERAAVTVLDKLTYAGNLANLDPVAGRYKFVHGDIGDAALTRDLLPGHDVVVNFAAETHVDRSIAGPAEFVTANVAGVLVLVDACRSASVERVVHVSTDEVYGSIATGSWTEASPLDPNSPYAAAKAGGDLIALAYARTYGLNLSITRCCNNYGPRQYPEKIIPLFVTNLLDRKPVPLYGDGGNVRGWVHVDDHCRGIQLVLERGAAGAVYHIDGDVELTNRELTGAILAACGASWEMVAAVPDRPGHDRRYSLDDSRLRSMGYAPRIRFEDGLAATVDWYAANRAWWEPLPRPAPPAALAARGLGEVARAGEDVVGHGRGEAPGERVLLTRVVAAEQQHVRLAGAGQRDLGPVAERRARPRHPVAGLGQHRPQRLPREPAQADDHPERPGDRRQLGAEPRDAGVALVRRRLVGGRRAAHHRRHPRAEQPLAVPGGDAVGLGGQPAPVERAEDEVAAAITGEHPAGPVAAVGGRGQADDEQERPLVAPARNRPAPVALVPERLALGDRDLLPPPHQPRAGAADRLPGLELRQRPGVARELGDLGGVGSDGRARVGRVLRPAGPRRHERLLLHGFRA
jgi:dTDP-glucose 4,6-dehydratase